MLTAVDTAIGVGSSTAGEKLAQRVTGIQRQIAQLDDQIANTPYYIDTRPLEFADSRLHDALTNASAVYARYVSFVAQYGPEIGESLEQLAESFDTTQKALANNPAALADATTNFNREQQRIIDGIATGVTGTLDQLAKLRQGLLDEVQKLKLGSSSPLAPLERLGIAQTTFDADAALARSGNLEAFGRLNQEADQLVTSLREVYGSANAFTTGFNEVTSTLTELGTPPVSVDNSFVDAGSVAVVSSVHENTAAVQENTAATQTVASNTAELVTVTEDFMVAMIGGFENMDSTTQEVYRRLVASWQASVRK
jgi:phage gp37-like protein